jgi:4-hydroxy-2-oxoheptanedioate aldolase
MRLPQNSFKAAIAAGKPQVGIWNSLCSEISADVLASAGFDWALLDMEHSPNELRTVLGQLQAYQGGSTVPIVRPPWNDTVIVKRLMDIGANSFLFPMIQSPEEAAAAVAATRYPPRGVRGVSLSTRANKWGRMTDYAERIEDEICVLVQVETRQALECVREIAEVDGVDGVFFGPADLSADLGQFGKLGHEDVRAAMLTAFEKVRAAGKPSGTLFGAADQATAWFKAGFTFVACGSDANLLARGADSLLAQMRQNLAS